VCRSQDVIQQLEFIGVTFQDLFGIIGGHRSREEFEGLFGTASSPVATDSDDDDDDGSSSTESGVESVEEQP
jgi:hypothetical protein